MADKDKQSQELNLDELLGQKTLIVRLDGVEYGLKTADSLSPEEYVTIMQKGAQFAALDVTALSNGSAAEVISGVDEFIRIVGPELANQKLSFVAKVRVLQFWKQQTSGTAEKNAGEAAASP